MARWRGARRRTGPALVSRLLSLWVMFDAELTEIEAEFFADGEALEQPVDSFADLDSDFVRPSLWQRLFGRRDAE